MTTELTEGSALQQYVILAKTAKGKACAALIQQALNAPNTYVFGELLEMPNVQQLADTEENKSLELLRIFAYGTWSDYKAGKSQFGELTALQMKKLKQLTIVTLSYQTKIIPYSMLQEQLDIPNLRELEDLIIDAIYQGIIGGQLDQKSKQLEVECAMGRDVRPEALNGIIDVLSQWALQSQELLSSIKNKIDYANVVSETEKLRKEEFSKRVDTIKTNLKLAMDTDMMQTEFEGEGFYDQEKRKPRAGKQKGSTQLRDKRSN